MPSSSGRTPNWSKWKYLPKVVLWQAIALSLNIDPDKVRREHRHYHLLRGKRFDEGEEFDLRLSIASNHLPELGQINTVVGHYFNEDPIICIDRLRDIAVSHWQWSLPEELMKPADSPEGKAKQREEVNFTPAAPSRPQKRGQYIPLLENFLDRLPEGSAMSHAGVAGMFIQEIKALKARGEPAPPLPAARYIEEQVEKLLPKLQARRARHKNK